MDKTKTKAKIMAYFADLIRDDPVARELIFRAIKSVQAANAARDEGDASIGQDKKNCPFGHECDGGWESRDPQTGRLCRDAYRRDVARDRGPREPGSIPS